MTSPKRSQQASPAAAGTDHPSVREAPGGSGAVLAATKLHIPAVRPELVPRRPLLDELVEGPPGKLTLIAAPAGYGKTTLLAEWCSAPAESRDFAWLSLDRGDDDPARFWTGVIDALRGVEPGLGERPRAALAARNIDVLEVALPLLLNELAELERRIVLVLDDYQLVRAPQVHRSLAFLLGQLPPTMQLVLATRVQPPLPLARLRAGGELREVGAGDLRFSEGETAELLRRALGLDLDRSVVARLRERAEGWPAGIYLAGLSMRDRPDPAGFVESFAGDDRHIVDYLSSEVLAGQPDSLRAFLLRTSVLDRLCGPLCDAVAERDDSGRLLEGLEGQNLFVVPLDNTRTWFRYHRLFGELLRRELELTDPEAPATLHRRACRWYRAAGSVGEAIHHAIAGGDLDGAVELVAASWNEFFNRGRLGTVERWLDALGRGAVVAHPRLCIAGAWLALDRGRLDEARDWIVAASEGAGEEGEEVRAAIGALRAVHGFKVGALGEAKEAAAEVLRSASPGDTFARTDAELILGATTYWGGELDEAAAALHAAARLAEAEDNDLGTGYALGYLALLAADRGDADEAERLGAAATGLSEAPGFVEHFVLTVAHLARGRAAESQGRLGDAERELARAVELSRRRAGRLEMAAALVAFARVRQLRGDRDEARALLREARETIDACSDPGTLAAAVAAGERALHLAGRGAALEAAIPGDELTDRELAVLRLLASDLSRREIADALYVSPNTVKTHLRGLYRKLDAATREGAVDRARELGLL